MTAPSFAERVADKLIERLEAGTAPWQRPWKEGPPEVPHNPVTGTRYRGINAVSLLMEQRSDPRWLTYRQAQQLGAQVQKGAQGQSIQYWKFREAQPQKDPEGRPVLDDSGQPARVVVELERPRVFYATVFSAEQIDGLPPLVVEPPRWDPLERAQALLDRSSARIEHGGNRAFYSPGTDTIRMPPKGQFDEAARYYATALHELSHWTGHESRLGRDLAHPFGSEGYAREELRAEIASMLLGAELGIGHDPDQHAAYVSSWIKSLKEDPLEIVRAATAAEKIQQFVLALEQSQTLSPEPVQSAPLENEESSAMSSSPRLSEARTYLAVPYKERHEAKAAGARWDATRKAWFVEAGMDLNAVQRWQLTGLAQGQAVPSLRQEFAAVLADLGCLVSGEHPIMDGKKHRIAADGDGHGEKAGFYVAHLDGRPAGYAENNRTGEHCRWKAKGYHLDEAERAELRAQAAATLEARALEEARRHEEIAQAVTEGLQALPLATTPTAYQADKGIGTRPGVYREPDGSTVLPAYDLEGRTWTLQRIDADGDKRFWAGGRKHGCFHVVGASDGSQALKMLHSEGPLVVAEGYATAASASEMLGRPVVAAFDAGNLVEVTRQLHTKWPERAILILADDDHRQQQARGINPGLDKAQRAALRANGTAVVVGPVFAPGEPEQGLTDFNDLATRSAVGRDGAAQQLEVAIALVHQRQRSLDQERDRSSARRHDGAVQAGRRR
jgi:putative DNA primase/helicase